MRVLACLLLAACAHAGSPARFCARAGTDDSLRPVPTALAPEVNALFHSRMPPAMVARNTVFRCDQGQVMLCTRGANLPCGKADTSRHSAGAGAWCRDHPDADFVPAFATGHATVFAWRCHGPAAAVAHRNFTVDRRGFIARFWQPLGAVGD